MRNNPKAGEYQRQPWEASGEGAWKRGVWGGCTGAPSPSEEGTGGWLWGEVPATACITVGPFCPLLRTPDTLATAGPQTGLLDSGMVRGKTIGPREQVSMCRVCNLALPNYPCRLDFMHLPPSRLPCPHTPAAQHFLGLFSSEMGGKPDGMWEDLKHLSEAWCLPAGKRADRAAVKFNCPQDDVLQCRICSTFLFILKTCHLSA